MSCQISLRLDYKHCCVIHNHLTNLPAKRNLFTDNGYQSYISNYLSKSKDDKDKNFWKDPDITSTNFKYCIHCKIDNGNKINHKIFQIF